MAVQMTVTSPTDFQVVEGEEMIITATFTTEDVYADTPFNYHVGTYLGYDASPNSPASENDFKITGAVDVVGELPEGASETFTLETKVVAVDDGVLEGVEVFQIELEYVEGLYLAEITILPEPATEGTNGADLYTGDAGTDHYLGLSGGDELHGKGGEDILSGGSGNDRVSGDGGSDRLHGDDGSDTLGGGEGHDFLDGWTGNDLLHGDNGDDILLGGAGKDKVEGAAGRDVLSGEEGKDKLWGGAKGDAFYFYSGKDKIKDFENKDDIVLDAALVGGPDATIRDVLDLARAEDDKVVIDFGSGDVLTINGVSSVQALADDLLFFTF